MGASGLDKVRHSKAIFSKRRVELKHSARWNGGSLARTNQMIKRCNLLLCTLTDKKHNSHTLSNLIVHDVHFWDSIAIRTLPAKDFQVYEDGAEQRVLGRG